MREKKKKIGVGIEIETCGEDSIGEKKTYGRNEKGEKRNNIKNKKSYLRNVTTIFSQCFTINFK